MKVIFLWDILLLKLLNFCIILKLQSSNFSFLIWRSIVFGLDLYFTYKYAIKDEGRVITEDGSDRELFIDGSTSKPGIMIVDDGYFKVSYQTYLYNIFVNDWNKHFYMNNSEFKAVDRNNGLGETQNRNKKLITGLNMYVYIHMYLCLQTYTCRCYVYTHVYILDISNVYVFDSNP